MNDVFSISVELLKERHSVKIDCQVEPHFIDIQEEDLSFHAPVVLKGECYSTNDSLILHLDIQTQATVSCAICNEKHYFKIDLCGLYHTVEMASCRGGIFRFGEIVREAILLETPLKSECGGNCPEREALSKFFSKEKQYYPFENMEQQYGSSS